MQWCLYQLFWDIAIIRNPYHLLCTENRTSAWLHKQYHKLKPTGLKCDLSNIHTKHCKQKHLYGQVDFADLLCGFSASIVWDSPQTAETYEKHIGFYYCWEAFSNCKHYSIHCWEELLSATTCNLACLATCWASAGGSFMVGGLIQMQTEKLVL